MTPDIPVLEALRRLQGGGGQAVFVREQLDHEPWKTVWLVRDEATCFADLGPESSVEFRAGAFEEGGVIVLPIVLRLGTAHSGRLYLCS